ncbi:MAG: type VI secretion system tip protein TssI/VgrG [Ancalomicrobiaceae bacterium]|nr:type VI secretion system tip protein TssI/VgrG [Ancalomicrobiaceae bacterium]
MGNFSQKGRPAQLTTPLGEDVLLLQRFNAHEAMSELFEFTVDALSEVDGLDFEPALGTNCHVTLRSIDGSRRRFNGILAEAEWTGLHDSLYTYRLVLRPWLWILSHRSNCRFFQEKTAPAIIQEVFDKTGMKDYELKLSGSYPEMEFCVQYRESDFAFVSRLMEEHGIYYYFKHDKSKHILVLADSPSGHDLIDAGGGTLPFIPLTGAFARDVDHIQHWTSERRFRSGLFAVNDYDFKKPGANLLADSQSSETYSHSKAEVYDYPGRYTDQGQGEKFAKVRLEAEQALDHRRVASGMAPSCYPGGKMKLARHPKESENAEYLIVRATHAVGTQHYLSGGTSGARDDYNGSYIVIPSSRPYRAPLITPKPLIHGIQTAKVVGDSGEEITVDKYGRIKVQFFWDRDKKQSCWIRVAEMYSGKSWGSVFHPRHDQEVVVEFLEGDPDRPLVVGTVYNGDNDVPYALPDKKNIGGWKTNSTKGGGGYNEFIYDDTKRSEEIRMHAEKDHNVVVKHAETWKIGETFETPKGSPSRDTTIENGDDNLEIKMGDQNIKIDLGDQNLTIGTGNQTVKITMNKTDDIGMSRSTTIGMSDTLEVGMSQEVTAGMSIEMTAGMSVTITGGAGIIELSPAGVAITAPTIELVGIVNIVGMVNIEGGLTVDGMVPMLLPV